jgi:hypothetical protein
MQLVTTIGLDIAKSVFQLHGVDAAGQVVIRRQLKRRYVLMFFQKLPPCLSVSRPVLPRIIGRANLISCDDGPLGRWARWQRLTLSVSGQFQVHEVARM